MAKLCAVVTFAFLCIVVGDFVAGEFVPCKGKTGCTRFVCPKVYGRVECKDKGDGKSYCKCLDNNGQPVAPNDDRCVETKDKSKNCYTDPPMPGATVEAWICPATKSGKDGKTTCYKRVVVPGCDF